MVIDDRINFCEMFAPKISEDASRGGTVGLALGGAG